MCSAAAQHAGRSRTPPLPQPLQGASPVPLEERGWGQPAVGYPTHPPTAQLREEGRRGGGEEGRRGGGEEGRRGRGGGEEGRMGRGGGGGGGGEEG